MAVYHGTSGKRTGSVGGETYAITRGTNIVREKIVQMTNPKTKSQMTQRAAFASAVRLYQLATQAFFKFAFEDKKDKESDYNAFMRHNIAWGAVVPPVGSADVDDYPCLGEWQWTAGRLALNATSSFYGGNGEFIMRNIIQVPGDFSSDVPTTMGELVSVLAEKGIFAVGDIITIPITYYQAIYVPGQIIPQGTQRNEFLYRQIKLDSADTTPISSTETIIDGIGISVIGASSSMAVNFNVHFSAPAEQLAGLIAQGTIIRSQLPTSGKLLVSTSYNTMSAGAGALYTMLQTDVIRERILQMWKARENAILEGKG